MKTRQNSKVYVEDIVHQTVIEIEKQHKHFTEIVLPLEADLLAQKNQPSSNETSITPYLTMPEGFYSGLKKQASLQLNGGLSKFNNSVIVPGLNDAIAKEEHEEEYYAHEAQSLRNEKKQLCMQAHPGVALLNTMALVVFAIAEISLINSGFLSFGELSVFALICGIALGIAQVLGAKTAVLHIRDSVSVHKKKRAFAIGLTACTIWSIGIGCLRYWAAHKSIGGTIPLWVLNPFLFAIMNLVLLVASSLIVYRYFPTLEETVRNKKIGGLSREISALERKQTKAKESAFDLTEKRATLVRTQGILAHNERELHALIDTYYKISVGRFIQLLASKRRDGAYPPCFKNTIPPLPQTSTEDPIQFVTLK